jgi:hypothetical protein
MREQWARRIAFLTGLLVLLLAAMFAITQNPIENSDRVESGERVPLPASGNLRP